MYFKWYVLHVPALQEGVLALQRRWPHSLDFSFKAWSLGSLALWAGDSFNIPLGDGSPGAPPHLSPIPPSLCRDHEIALRTCRLLRLFPGAYYEYPLSGVPELTCRATFLYFLCSPNFILSINQCLSQTTYQLPLVCVQVNLLENMWRLYVQNRWQCGVTTMEEKEWWLLSLSLQAGQISK